MSNAFPLRKGPSGPPLVTFPEPAGATLRIDSTGDEVEAVAGTIAGQLWFWSGTTSRFSTTGPSNGQLPIWSSATNDWTFQARNQRLVYAVEFDDPNSADWAVNALAPAAADTVNAAKVVRRFDDFNEEGIGWSDVVPSGATNLSLSFFFRAQTAPGSAQNVQLRLYARRQPNDAAVGAWSAGTNLGLLSTPSTANFKLQAVASVALSTLGLLAGDSVQFELTRADAGLGLPGDFDLEWLSYLYG